MKRFAIGASVATLLAVGCVVVFFLSRPRDAIDVDAVQGSEAAVSKPTEIAPIEAATISDSAERVALAVEKPASEGGPLAKFNGRLIYESTGEGIPWFVVTMEAAGLPAESRVTDAEGRFHSRRPWPIARTNIFFSDPMLAAFGERRAVKREGDGEAEVTLVLQAAPTYVIHGGFPEGIDPSALKTNTGDRLRRGDEQWFVRQGHGGLEDPPHWRHEQPPGRQVFTLQNESSMWIGECVIDHPGGIVQARLEWKVVGRIALAIHGNWAETPPPRSVSLSLKRNGIEQWSHPDLSLEWLRGSPWEISGIEPGLSSLSITSLWCEAIERPVLVRADDVTQVEVQLSCAANAGAIRGEITTQSGQPLGKEIYAEASRGDWEQSLDLAIERDAPGWKASFVLESVPAGDIAIRIEAGEFGTEPAHPIARAGETLSVLVLDRPTNVDLGFRVFDAVTGAELGAYDAEIWISGRNDLVRPRGLPFGGIAIEHVPMSGKVAWRVTSSGYLCAEGNLADQVPWGKTEGSKRWLDVRLERGWRLSCSAREEVGEHLEGLQGAAIVVDGTEVCVTGADGEFERVFAFRPTSLEVRHANLRCVRRYGEPLESMTSCDRSMWIFGPR